MLIYFSILEKLCESVRDPPGFIGASKFSVSGLGLTAGSSNSEDSLLLQIVEASLTYYNLRSVLSGKNAAYTVEKSSHNDSLKMRIVVESGKRPQKIFHILD